MATNPTVDQTIRAILDAAATYEPRAGEIVPTIGVQTKLHNTYRAEDLNKAFEAMIEQGLIEPEIGRHFKLTEKGYSEM